MLTLFESKMNSEHRYRYMKIYTGTAVPIQSRRIGY